MDRNEAHIAFEILLEEIEDVANRLNDGGANASRSGNYEAAQRAVEAATRLAELSGKGQGAPERVGWGFRGHGAAIQTAEPSEKAAPPWSAHTCGVWA